MELDGADSEAAGPRAEGAVVGGGGGGTFGRLPRDCGWRRPG